MLIDNIIQLLSDNKASLTDALLKTKVLLHKIGRKDLVEWVNYELNGYPDGVVIPEYRALQSKLVGNVSNGFCRFTHHPLPVGHLKPEQQQNFTQVNLAQSLAIIEQFGSDGALSREVPPEAYGLLGKALGNGYEIERAWCETPAHDVRGVLTQIRSRLLDFVLELKDTLGDSESDEIMKAKAEAVDTTALFQHALFGDNTTIVLGSNNRFAVRNEVLKGDFNSLATTLEKAGIPHDEIDCLREAVTSDEAEGGAALSKGKTGQWFLKLMERAAKGGLKIGTDVVAHVATEAINSYLGGS